MTIEIPLVGIVTPSSDFPQWLESEPIALPLMDGMLCRFILEGYQDDPRPEDFHAAIANLLAAKPDVFRAVEKDVFQYYVDKDCNVDMDEEDWIVIDNPEDVWEFVDFGSEFHLSRRHYGDEKIYASLTCGCEWEEEHGLEFVFKEGKYVNKLGWYDGHATNADSHDHPPFEDVIYVDQEKFWQLMRDRNPKK